jgi:hypothetical protein
MFGRCNENIAFVLYGPRLEKVHIRGNIDQCIVKVKHVANQLILQVHERGVYTIQEAPISSLSLFLLLGVLAPKKLCLSFLFILLVRVCKRYC